MRAAASSWVLVTLCRRRIRRRVESRMVTSSEVSDSMRRSSLSVATKVESGMPRFGAVALRHPEEIATMRATTVARVRIMRQG
ncbi:MAG TPA: hypothetical protein VIM15_07875 [Gemmatimonadaceae bacterium]